MNGDDTCRIWGSGYPATVRVSPDPSYAIVDSARAGGEYKIDGDAKPYICQLDVRGKALLTTWLVDQRMRRIQIPEITGSIVQYVKSRPSLQVYERAERLLRFIAKVTPMVGEYVPISPEDCQAACAWSESIEWREVHYLLGYLKDKGWVQAGTFQHNMFKGIATVDGYSLIAERQLNVDSSQTFVAMWFHDSMGEASKKGIEPAITEAGFKPLRVDRKEHVNKIDDEIIAELRRSRFLVADFTHGEDGARGGVYYEAGFAHGLNLPVIFTCRADAVETLHFDTEHYNHIVWTTPEDLREKLKNRILAVIGEGPGAHTTP